MDVVYHQLQNLASSITEEAVQRSKSQLKGSMMLSLESMSSRMSSLAKNEINYGRIIPPDEMIAEIDAVEREQIIDLAEELSNPANLSIAAIGPLDDVTWGDLKCRKIC